MATYGGKDIVGDCWGLDTAMAGALTDEQLEAALKTPLPNKQFPIFLWGYGPFSGAKPSAWDWTASSLKRAMDVGWICLLVQHCRAGAWVASAQLGDDDGKCIADFATSINYGDDCHIALDDESLKNPGPDAIAHVTKWCANPKNPLVYEGFDPGLTPQEEYELPDVTAYWGAYGPWNVATRGVRCRQGLQITHAGIGFDPDHASPDAMGGVLRGMALLST